MARDHNRSLLQFDTNQFVKTKSQKTARKHTKVVEQLLRHLGGLELGTALKMLWLLVSHSKQISLSSFQLRHAQKGLRVATLSDSKHLHIWKGREIR